MEAGAARAALGALMVHVDERYDNNSRNNSGRNQQLRSYGRWIAARTHIASEVSFAADSGALAKEMHQIVRTYRAIISSAGRHLIAEKIAEKIAEILRALVGDFGRASAELREITAAAAGATAEQARSRADLGPISA